MDPAASVFDSKPAVVIWELTQACALACVHCRARARLWRDPAELTTQEGFGLLDQAAELGRPLFILTGGDPFERGDLEALVRHGTGRGLTMALSPSATDKVTLPALSALKAAGLHRVALSLDSADQQRHDAFRGVAGSFWRTMEIAAAARALGLPLQIGTTLTAGNAGELEAVAALVERLGVVLWSVFLLVPTGRARPSDMVTAEQCEDLLTRLHRISSRVRFRIKTTEGPHYRRIAVQHSGRALPPGPGINDAKGFVFISHTGEVYPSGFLPVSAGSVRRESLASIYRDSPLFRTLRDPAALKGRCGRCEFKRLCGGSRARAYALTGDYLAEDPLCAYQPCGAAV